MTNENGRTKRAENEGARFGEEPTQGCCARTPENIEEARVQDADPRIVDHKVTLLIAAGAAMAANCERCLNKVVPDLIKAGVAASDIRAAVKIGQFVKDRPAATMKDAADVLAGTHLSDGAEAEGCPAEAMKRAASM